MKKVSQTYGQWEHLAALQTKYRKRTINLWQVRLSYSNAAFILPVCVCACVHVCVCVCGCRVLSDGRMIRLFFAIQLHQYELLMHVRTGLTFNCVTCQSEKTNSKLPAVVTAHFSCCAIKFNIKNSYCATCVYREVRTLRERSGRSDSDDARASCTCREAVGSFPECPMVHHNVSTVVHNG